MRAAAAYNRPSNRLEPSPISSPDSFILAVPRPILLTLTAAKDIQPCGARAHGAWMKAQAPNRNRPGTHLPPKMALNRPSFLIHCPELDIELNYTKHTPAHISNRQFFVFLKLPDTLLRVSLRPAGRLRCVRPAPQKSPRPTAKCERLIGNEFRFAASAFSPFRPTSRPSFFDCRSSIFGISAGE
jgi:hypothetical protein